MAKFTKLNIGDSVASGGGRAWKKLLTQLANVKDDLAGIWRINASPLKVLSALAGTYTVSGAFNAYSSSTGYPYSTAIKSISIKTSTFPALEVVGSSTYTLINRYYDSGGTVHGTDTSNKSFSISSTSSKGKQLRLLVITSKLSEVTNGEKLLEWLQANATKEEVDLSYSRSIIGTWTFKSKPTRVSGYTSFQSEHQIDLSMDFSADNINYTRLFAEDQFSHSTNQYDSLIRIYYSNNISGGFSGTGNQAWYDGSWEKEGYKTIVITRGPYLSRQTLGNGMNIPGVREFLDFFKWIKANATKQNDNLIPFAIGSLVLDCEEGMTWAQWCNSEYNSIGAYVLSDGKIWLDGEYLVDYNYNNVFSTDTITIAEYNFYYPSGGGGSN